jgi:hypothetical protein
MNLRNFHGVEMRFESLKGTGLIVKTNELRYNGKDGRKGN